MVKAKKAQILSWLFLLCWLSFYAGQSRAATPDIRLLQSGWQLYKLDKFEQAALAWQGASVRVLNEGRQIDSLRVAALAQVLAAIAYEREDNFNAYQAWANSQTYLLESNLRWSDFQLQIKAWSEQELLALTQSISDVAPVGVTSLDSETRQSGSLMLDLEHELALTEYQGPKPGLRRVDESVQKDQLAGELATRSYVSRPRLITQTNENTDEVIIGRSVINEDASQAQQIDNVTTVNVEQEQRFRAVGVRGLTSTKAVEINDTLLAQRAWQYFENNVDPDTGFSYDTHDYPYTTMWGLGSYLAALVSAQKLDVIPMSFFERRLDLLLTSLNRMPLYQNEMPNRQYQANTLGLTDIKNEVSETGSGWSAIGTARLLIWLKITAQWYPEFANSINGFVGRLNFDRVLAQGQLNGAFFDGTSESVFVEGRLGYEQYAASGYQLWGANADNALDYNTVNTLAIYGFAVPFDNRDGSYLVSDPFYLAKMEMPEINKKFSDHTDIIYNVQAQHSETIKRPVAQTELHLPKTPWFIYYNIAGAEKTWQVTSYDGNEYPTFAGFSTHGVFMTHALYPGKYEQSMMKEVESLASDGFGYYVGKLYDGSTIRTLSSHSNGVILQSVLYNRLKKSFIADPGATH